MTSETPQDVSGVASLFSPHTIHVSPGTERNRVFLEMAMIQEQLIEVIQLQS